MITYNLFICIIKLQFKISLINNLIGDEIEDKHSPAGLHRAVMTTDRTINSQESLSQGGDGLLPLPARRPAQ
jgi:hypothetical protein